jgi:hypothetical protein
MQLESTPEVEATTPAAEPARPETVAETLAKTLQSFEGETEADTLPEPPEQQPEADEPDEANDDDDEPAEAAELEELQAPNHWPKDFAAKFEALDAPAQHMFMERYKDLEGDYTKENAGDC